MHEAAVDSMRRPRATRGALRPLVSVTLPAFVVGCGDDFDREEASDTVAAKDGAAGASSHWEGVAVGSSGVLTAGTRIVNGSGFHGRLARYQTNGKVVWSKTVTYGTSAQLFDVTWLPDGGGVAVGSASVSSEQPLAVRFAADGTIFCAP